MDLAIAYLIVIVVVYVATLARLEARKTFGTDLPVMGIINTIYISVILGTIIALFEYFGAPINNSSIFTVLMIIAFIIIFHSHIEDVVAYTLAMLTNAYGSNSLIKAGDTLGQVMGMNMFVATLDNHHTKTRTYMPHSTLYLLNAHKI